VINQHGNVPAVIANSKTVELVMTQQDGAQSPSGFVLLTDGRFKQAYQVKSASTDSCKTTTYTLVPIQDSANYILNVSESIQVLDHSNRICLDFRKFVWELNVTHSDLTHEVTGQIQLVGNPESVIVTQ
jgi:hypothetical protein